MNLLQLSANDQMKNVSDEIQNNEKSIDIPHKSILFFFISNIDIVHNEQVLKMMVSDDEKIEWYNIMNS